MKPIQKSTPIPVADPSPYPEISITQQNLRYARILTMSFSSPKSELTSIHQYLYQNWIFTAKHREMAETFKRIAGVEMHHYNLLGQMITALGGSPKVQFYRQNTPVPWNGNFILYNRNLKQLLRQNILTEQGAIDLYAKHSKMIGDECVSKVLSRIILDEQIHVDILKGFLSELGG